MQLISLWKEVYALLRARGASHHDAEDLAQNVFADLAAKGHLGDDGHHLSRDEMGSKRYVFAMARNELVDSYRRASAGKRGGDREPSSLTAEALDRTESLDSRAPDDEVMQREAWEAWESQLTRLGDEIEETPRKALFLKVRPYLLTGERTEDLSQISRETTVSLTSVRVQIHRWRRRLQERFQEEYEAALAA